MAVLSRCSCGKEDLVLAEDIELPLTNGESPGRTGPVFRSHFYCPCCADSQELRSLPPWQQDPSL